MPSLCQLTCAIAIATITSPLGGVTHEKAVEGEWILNRDLTPATPARDDMKRPEGQRPPGGRGGPPAGGGVFGGGFGNRPGGGRRGPSEKDMRKLEAVRRRIDDTFAISLLLKGVELSRVSILLGHSSVKVTERHYSPWVRARQEQLEADVRLTWAPIRKGKKKAASSQRTKFGTT